MDIGEIIKKRREELGMSQEELAKQAGYRSRSSINKIEVDGRGLPQKKIMNIARALQTTPSYLMGWDNGIRAFSQNLDFLLKQKKISVESLAKESYVDESRITLFLHDKEDPTMSELSKLASYFNVDRDKLLSEDITIVTSNYELALKSMIVQAEQLNEEGINKVAEYIRDLSDKYSKGL